MTKIITKKIIFVLTLIPLLFACEKNILKTKETLYIEYGQPIPTAADQYLITNQLSQNETKDITNQTTVTLPNIPTSEITPIGEYIVKVHYQKESAKVKVIIRDTTAPTFSHFQKEIKFIKDSRPSEKEIKKFFKATDLSPTTIIIDDSKVDYHTIGSYPVTITATDKYHNQTIQKSTFQIINKTTKSNPIKDSDFVNVKKYIPNIYIDLKYATTDNFTKTKIYHFKDAYLRYKTTKQLKAAQSELNKLGYSIKIWDAYRPFSAQKKLWEVCPNPRYVANPNKGPRPHNYGNTVDITLVKLNGQPIDMPTDFDDFSKKADRDYSDIQNQSAIEHACLLEEIMEKHGFTGYKNEWWHYSHRTQYSFQDWQPK